MFSTPCNIVDRGSQRTPRNIALCCLYNSGVREMNLTAISLSQLTSGQVQLLYRHDGSESASDEFQLSVSDGRQQTTRRCRVMVMAVNDARPLLTTNSVLRVALGGSTVVTRSSLRAADQDSDDQQVHAPPPQIHSASSSSSLLWLSLSSFV